LIWHGLVFVLVVLDRRVARRDVCIVLLRPLPARVGAVLRPGAGLVVARLMVIVRAAIAVLAVLAIAIGAIVVARAIGPIVVADAIGSIGVGVAIGPIVMAVLIVVRVVAEAVVEMTMSVVAVVAIMAIMPTAVMPTAVMATAVMATAVMTAAMAGESRRRKQQGSHHRNGKIQIAQHFSLHPMIRDRIDGGVFNVPPI
jgi:hypothetical protein